MPGDYGSSIYNDEEININFGSMIDDSDDFDRNYGARMQ